MRVAAVLFLCCLLFACQPQNTGNAVTAPRGPQKSCSLTGFSCFPEASVSSVRFSLRNAGMADMMDLSVSLASEECVANPVSVGRLPAGAQTNVEFKCAAPPPSTVTGMLSATYRTGTGPSTTATGKLSYRG